MKSMILAALTGAALVISGCGNAEPERDTVITSVEPLESNSGFSATEEEFLYDVSNHMTPDLHREPQADVVELGYSICSALDNGASLEQIIRVGVNNGLTATDTSVIAAAATVNFCPELQDSL